MRRLRQSFKESRAFFTAAVDSRQCAADILFERSARRRLRNTVRDRHVKAALRDGPRDVVRRTPGLGDERSETARHSRRQTGIGESFDDAVGQWDIARSHAVDAEQAQHSTLDRYRTVRRDEAFDGSGYVARQPAHVRHAAAIDAELHTESNLSRPVRAHMLARSDECSGPPRY